MSERNDLYDATYVLWIDYGYEGWHPHGFDTIDECYLRAIDYSAPRFLITKTPIRVAFTEEHAPPAPVREGNPT